jgi:hypothetical protein
VGEFTAKVEHIVDIGKQDKFRVSIVKSAWHPLNPNFELYKRHQVPAVMSDNAQPTGNPQQLSRTPSNEFFRKYTIDDVLKYVIPILD